MQTLRHTRLVMILTAKFLEKVTLVDQTIRMINQCHFLLQKPGCHYNHHVHVIFAVIVIVIAVYFLIKFCK